MYILDNENLEGVNPYIIAEATLIIINNITLTPNFLSNLKIL